MSILWTAWDPIDGNGCTHAELNAVRNSFSKENPNHCVSPCPFAPFFI